MPRKTDGDKIDEAREILAGQVATLQRFGTEVTELRTELRDLRSAITDLQTRLVSVEHNIDEFARWRDAYPSAAEIQSQIAVLQHEIRNLIESRRRWANRLWLIVPPFLAAIAGALLGYFLGQWAEHQRERGGSEAPSETAEE